MGASTFLRKLPHATLRYLSGRRRRPDRRRRNLVPADGHWPGNRFGVGYNRNVAGMVTFYRILLWLYGPSNDLRIRTADSKVPREK